ncbi:1869_t:CDS:2, partial [Scutellospora calospora]
NALNNEEEMPKLNILDAIKFITEAWDNLILEIPYHLMRVMTANDYIEADNNLETEEVTIDEAAIIEEICHQSDFSNSDEDSDVEIEKISHSVALEQCKSLILYVEQQDPTKFVKDQDLLVLRNLLKRIRLNESQSKRQK